MKTFLQVKKLQMEQILRGKWEELLGEEGASEYVGLIVMIVIIIAIAAIFQDQLQAAVENVFGKLGDVINGGL